MRSCPSGELSWWEIVLMGSCVAIVGNRPSGELSWGSCPSGELS